MGDIAIPYLFAALMALEFGYNALRRNGYQDPRDSATSLMVAIPHFALLAIVPVVWFVVYRALEPMIPGTLPADAWWIWPLGILVMDFAAYWMHRYHHALNLTWGVHSVHHSSEHLTVTTGARSSVAEPFVNVVSGAYLILVAPALLGLPAAAAGLGWLVKDCWGFAVHTRNIRTLGPLEYVLATPSHHRVHHATNPVYANKNYGFVFIWWDKLFGTFQPELDHVPPVYGTARPPGSYQPIAVAFHELRLVWRDAVATRRWRDKLRIWYMPAGWRPDDVAGEPVARRPAAAPAWLYPIGILQLVALVACVFHLSLDITTYPLADNAAYLGFVITGTIACGEFFERSPRLRWIELARAAAVAGMVGATGAWFGRSIDGLTYVVGTLCVLNVIVALVATRYTDRHALRIAPGRLARRVRDES
ncbi:MAG TPA: sterol desaturase family protein [Kofleriaceae bacterium]|nr:sterol desaturase family protein [Kofleriaceae bacterium]